MEDVECPICGVLFAKSVISAHADRCIDETDIDDDECTSDVCLSSNSKRPRVEQATDVTSTADLAPCSSPTFCRAPTCPPLNTEATVVSVALSTDRHSLRHSPAQNMGNGVRDHRSRTPLPRVLKSILDIVLYLLKAI